MRFADWAIDFAAVARATGAVASRHAAIRARQLEGGYWRRAAGAPHPGSPRPTAPRPPCPTVPGSRPVAARPSKPPAQKFHSIESLRPNVGATAAATVSAPLQRPEKSPSASPTALPQQETNLPSEPTIDPVQPPDHVAPSPAQTIEPDQNEAVTGVSTGGFELRESRVPATRLGRLWNYSGLAVGMLGGAIGEGLSRAARGAGTGAGTVLLSGGNVERLVARLSRMRGAALKLGQMASFQDSRMLPAALQEVLQRVQDRADYMPAWQRDQVLVANLGADWRALFDDFDDRPIAAASIGQVHRATLRSTEGGGVAPGTRVAVKIQFPGVAASIDSDLDNLSVLLTASRLLPRGLFLDRTIANARTELAWECDYTREAASVRRYRDLLADDAAVFAVPAVHAAASGPQVLTMDWMGGTAVTRLTAPPQPLRDWIGTQLLRLCLRELVEFHFMQTDPNWTNFLYNRTTNHLELLDLGAARDFSPAFAGRYVQLLAAGARADRQAVRDLSTALGYLTGHESRAMVDAHLSSVLTLAEPFARSASPLYDFANQTVTGRVRALIPVMLRERLAPPPEETYSLHRKLSGAFLLCSRLGSRVRCRDLFEDCLRKAGLGDLLV